MSKETAATIAYVVMGLAGLLVLSIIIPLVILFWRWVL